MTKRNQIKIHQAYYGEVNRSHGCLSSTIEDAELKTFLTGFTDRPSAMPAGIAMQPYYSATVYGKHYIFTLSFNDNTAQRAGMVFTHVLIIDVNDIEYATNLNNLFNFFCKTIPEDKNITQELSVPISVLEICEVSNSFPEYVIQFVRNLVDGKLPLLFCGEAKSFISLIASVWAGLPSSFRIKISFTAGFSTVNIDSTKTVIHFQKSLENSLKNSEFISDVNTNLIEANSTVEKYILNTSSDNQFELFIKDLNVDLNNWSVLQICVKAYEGYQRYSELNNDGIKQLIRQLAKISPSENDGKLIKDKVISELKQRINSSTETNFKSLKNLPIHSYDSGEKTISDAVYSITETKLIKGNDFNAEIMSEAIVLSHNETKINWWHASITSALKNTIKNNTVSIQNLWSLLICSKDSLSVVLSFLPEKKAFENLLIKHIPKNIPQDIAKSFANAIQKRKWRLLHAYLIQTYLTAKEALKQQLSLEKGFSSDTFEGSIILAKATSDGDVLSLAIETKEKFFIDEYAARSVKNPMLLNELDVRNETWLSIWASSIQKTANLKHGILKLSENVELLLSSIPEGIIIPDEIINQIAKSKYADISKLKNRTDIWKYLSSNVKGLFLEATANRLIENISSEGLANTEIELINHISSDAFMTGVLKTYRADINVVIEIYNYITGLKDSFLADYIKFYPNNINEVQSDCLGTLVLSKRYSQSARQIFEKAKQNSNFKIALTKCQSIAGIGFWDRLLWGGLIGETVSPESVYSELTRIAIKLYDKGPEDQDVWKRAGGDLSKLHNNKTREDNWRNAIALLRNGGGGKELSVKSLIKQMIEDHPNNTELKEIKKYFK